MTWRLFVLIVASLTASVWAYRAVDAHKGVFTYGPHIVAVWSFVALLLVLCYVTDSMAPEG